MFPHTTRGVAVTGADNIANAIAVRTGLRCNPVTSSFIPPTRRGMAVPVPDAAVCTTRSRYVILYSLTVEQC